VCSSRGVSGWCVGAFLSLLNGQEAPAPLEGPVCGLQAHLYPPCCTVKAVGLRHLSSAPVTSSHPTAHQRPQQQACGK